MNIVMVPVDSIRPADWRATYMLKPDMKLLTKSMMEYGWLSPITVRKSDSRIIDGFHRWLVAQDQDFIKKHGKKIPVIFVDIDAIDSMIMHIRLNRARGSLIAKFVSRLINDIVRSKKYERSELKQLLTMGDDEIEVLLNGTLLKQRKISEYQYSKAWVPVEAPAGSVEAAIIETPPNADR